MKVQTPRSKESSTPVRLKRDPIVEAVCEIRFAGSDSSAALLPGLLQPKVSKDYPKFEKLATAEIPVQIREVDPNLQYAPLFRLVGQEGVVSIGSRSLSVAVTNRAYPGWDVFREKVLRVFRAAIETGHLGRISRVSVKYVNIFNAEGPQELSAVTRVAVDLGEYSVSTEPFQLRTELRRDDLVTVVQVVNPATVSREGGQQLTGVVLDIDTIHLSVDSEDSDRIAKLLDEAHSEEKRVFFSLLSEKTLSDCEPQYA